MHLVGFMIGRFAGSAIMRKVPAPRLLSIFGAGSLICLTVALFATGSVPVWAIVLVGFFHSIMFPTIFALSLKNLGPYTKLGSSVLVMSIIGAAICPARHGHYFRRHKYSERLHRSAALPCLRTVFRSERLQASDVECRSKSRAWRLLICGKHQPGGD